MIFLNHKYMDSSKRCKKLGLDPQKYIDIENEYNREYREKYYQPWN